MQQEVKELYKRIMITYRPESLLDCAQVAFFLLRRKGRSSAVVFKIFPSRIPDPGSKRTRIRIHIKEFEYFKPKTLFLNSRKYDPGCSSRIQIPDPDLWFSSIPDPGVKKAPDPGSGSATLVVFFTCAGILEQSMGARNCLVIGLSYGPAEGYIGWRNRLLDSLKV